MQFDECKDFAARSRSVVFQLDSVVVEKWSLRNICMGQLQIYKEDIEERKNGN